MSVNIPDLEQQLEDLQKKSSALHMHIMKLKSEERQRFAERHASHYERLQKHVVHHTLQSLVEGDEPEFDSDMPELTPDTCPINLDVLKGCMESAFEYWVEREDEELSLNAELGKNVRAIFEAEQEISMYRAHGNGKDHKPIYVGTNRYTEQMDEKFGVDNILDIAVARAAETIKKREQLNREVAEAEVAEAEMENK